MKKFQFLYTLAILLPCSLGAMSMQRMLRTPSRFEFQRRSCSDYNSPKSLGKLSFYEVSKLAHNKELAQKEFKSALARHEDTKAISVAGEQLSDAKSFWKKIFKQFSTKTVSASDEQSNEVKNAWKKVFAQFSIQDWNSMLLEREEQPILEAIQLPDFVKKINFKNHEEIYRRSEDRLGKGRPFHDAQLLDESLQKYYQKNLQDVGYPKIQYLIYHTKEDYYGGPAFCTYPSYIGVKPEFFDLPLEERLGILAHEIEHVDNLHIRKKSIVCPFETQMNRYSQFHEKEADLKASAHSLTIATGLLDHLKRCEKENYEYYKLLEKRKKLENSLTSHPFPRERINYIQDLIGKLEQEQKGYSWNPFYKILGLKEWFKK